MRRKEQAKAKLPPDFDLVGVAFFHRCNSRGGDSLRAVNGKETTENQTTKKHMNTDNEEKKLALAKYLECEPDELSEERHDCYGMTVFSLGSKEYAIATDDEADEAWDQSLDSYIEECITPEMEKVQVGNLAAYITFDEESWKRDARMDGRGHSLSSYDSNEDEAGDFYVYRLN